MSKKLLTELRSFAETTSVRGIPRVMKAKTRVTFVVWLVAVLTCAALLVYDVWQLSVVLTRYFQYPVSTLTVQAPAWQNPTFPDITICNLDPNVYFDYLNFDPNNPIASLNQSFSYTMDDSPTIPDPYYMEWSAYPFNEILCQISGAFDTMLYKCFTIRPSNTMRGNIGSFNAILHVDEVNDEPNSINLYTYPTNQLTGLSVLVHAPNTAPDMTFGMYTVAGTYTNIQLTQSVRTRLGQPYSNCTDKPYLPWDHTSDVHTQRYCVNTCVQQQIVDQCGCVGNQTTACEHEVLMSNISAVCSAACVLPCTEIQYDATMSLATWPQASWVSSFSNIYLLDPRFFNLLNISANATVEELNATTTTPAAIDFFKSRFLWLSLQFGTQSFDELNDVAAFSVVAMGAQIGGVLSLWLGVTVMFAFEAFEFIYIYLTDGFKKEPTPARKISVTPAVETRPWVNPMQSGPSPTAPSNEKELSKSVVVQIE